MKHPSTIFTEFGDKYVIVSYENGAFILEENPFFISYLIETNVFTRWHDGRPVSSGVKAMNHETYLDWKRRFDEDGKEQLI